MAIRAPSELTNRHIPHIKERSSSHSFRGSTLASCPAQPATPSETGPLHPSSAPAHIIFIKFWTPHNQLKKFDQILLTSSCIFFIKFSSQGVVEFDQIVTSWFLKVVTSDPHNALCIMSEYYDFWHIRKICVADVDFQKEARIRTVFIEFDANSHPSKEILCIQPFWSAFSV